MVKEGIVIRRLELPSGDVVVTLLGEDGKWRGIARKGKLLGGNPGKLSLFHDVSVQVYRKRDEDLALITQVQLGGALSKLSHPDIYPYAHLLAELADKLTVDVQPGEGIYGYLTGGLRGLAQHDDPEAVALVMCWKLLAQAGLTPRMARCARCGAADVGQKFDVAAGGMTCQRCDSGMLLTTQTISELSSFLLATVRQALEKPILERKTHWALLSRYLAFHVGELSSLLNLRLEYPA